MKHVEIRETQQWGSPGPDGVTLRYIKDLSNAHLKNIIPFIECRLTHYSYEILNIMKNEVKYRIHNNIFIPEYNKRKLTLLKNLKK